MGGSTKSGSSEDINALRDELDDAVRSKNRFQEELVSSKNRIAELEQKLAEGNGSTGEATRKGTVIATAVDENDG